MTARVALVATSVLWVLLLPACERSGNEMSPAAPTARIVTLAPHLAELVFAAGAGGMLVGVSAYSDFPQEARDIEVVSDAFTVDQERLRLLAPDLVLAWESGTPTHVIGELEQSGYRVESIRTRTLDDIANAIRRIGSLTRRATHAEAIAADFESGIQALRDQYGARATVTAFYQVSLKPLYTINGEHYISEVLELCGGHNIFAGLNELAPAITVESVVDYDPEVVLAGSADGDSAFVEWRRWPHLQANQFENYFTVNSDEIVRPSIRLVAAAKSICEHLESARQRKGTG